MADSLVFFIFLGPMDPHGANSIPESASPPYRGRLGLPTGKNSPVLADNGAGPCGDDLVGLIIFALIHAHLAAATKCD